MPSLGLRSFVARSAALVDSSPPESRQETRTWLVEPFLETLGWDLRADSCATDRTVDETRLAYVPTIDGVPALVVAIEAYDESLEKSRANALQTVMAWTGVDRAIYTNGREYLLLSGSTDADSHAFTLSELADNDSAVGEYSRATVGQRLEHHSRTHVARRLAIERPRLVDAIVDQLLAATRQGDVYAGELESAAERFLDQLVVAFADDGPDDQETTADVSIRFSESAIADDETSTDPDARSGPTAEGPTSDDAAEDESNATRPRWERTSDSSEGAGFEWDTDDTAGPESDDRAGATARDTDAEGSSTDAETDAQAGTEDGGTDGTGDGEYVVRFFNERGSIGAIGHSTPEGALVGTAEYLFDRGLSGVTVPWSPDDSDDTVLNAEPTHADGTPMSAPTQLSNGLYLATAGDVDDHAARIEALAARAGLRAMLSGDWEAE
ncbi:hypothetical protein [Natrinema salsiterrestre]|uniref:Type I restriction enzyme R protein N-terminal domain-containing protein n=1 Tax=Natrinema salsiterrestre TaxID=2950540 RepID=A0A9Q4L2C3_9EURY|nr:hypothetical protein [Natrinema salsiterrestre]MDF9746362.1 hypothetical protein [Natrinema salsiterrestre]